jgi:hypothetical protein
LRINFRKKIKKLLLKGVGAEHQETLSVPLLRYSAPAVVPFSRVRAKRGIEGVRQDDLLVGTYLLPLSRGIRGGLHIKDVLHLSKRKSPPLEEEKSLRQKKLTERHLA